MSVYVLHIDPPYQHARHYIGYTPDKQADRRIAEHTSCGAKGSPLIRAAVQAGCTVTVAHVYPGATRQAEAWLKSRRDTRRWCPCCGVNTRKLPDVGRIPARFKAAKKTTFTAVAVADEEDDSIPF